MIYASPFALGGFTMLHHSIRWVAACAATVSVFALLSPAAPMEPVEITILRDDFGIPNIFAKTEEGAVYGMGYAQAEDRLEEILKQYRRAEGTMAEFFGPENLQDDYRQRLWQHRAISEASYDKQ